MGKSTALSSIAVVIAAFIPGSSCFGAAAPSVTRLTDVCSKKDAIRSIDVYVMPPRIGSRADVTPAQLVKMVLVRSFDASSAVGVKISRDVCALEISSRNVAADLDTRVGIVIRTRKSGTVSLYSRYPYRADYKHVVLATLEGTAVSVKFNGLRQLVNDAEANGAGQMSPSL